MQIYISKIIFAVATTLHPNFDSLPFGHNPEIFIKMTTKDEHEDT